MTETSKMLIKKEKAALLCVVLLSKESKMIKKGYIEFWIAEKIIIISFIRELFKKKKRCIIIIIIVVVTSKVSRQFAFSHHTNLHGIKFQFDSRYLHGFTLPNEPVYDQYIEIIYHFKC